MRKLPGIDSVEKELIMGLPAGMTSYDKLLKFQRDLFHDQVEKLKHIVITHFKSTGVYPLSHEMASGALFPKIGNRPIDSLSPTALNYMEHVFSIKDTVGKKEAWDISRDCGVTVSQVREYLNFQQSTVRKLVKLSGEKASAPIPNDALHVCHASTSEPHMTADPVPLDTTAPTCIVEGTPCSLQHGVLNGMTEPEKTFISDIFYLMRKEKTFSGQVELMERIMEKKNIVVQNWFVNEGGLMILESWLSEAIMEEQTSVIDTILKVLFSLPLENATPEHMSSLLESVNSLKFYRSSATSECAKTLLDRCGKKNAWNQPLETSSADKPDSDTKEVVVLEQSIHKIMSFTSGGVEYTDFEEFMEPFCENQEKHIEQVVPCPQKISMAPEDMSNDIQGILLSGIREYRKVKVTKHVDRSLPGRSLKAAKSFLRTRSPANESQKAKIGSHIMQDNFKKPIICLDDQGKTESHKGAASSLANDLPFASKRSAQADVEKCEKSGNTFTRTVNPRETSCLNLKPPCKKFEKMQLPWPMPPGIQDHQELEIAKHQDQSIPGRSPEVAFSSFITQSPADEFLKSKIGSQIMQDKFKDPSICLYDQVKFQSRKGSTSSQANDLPYTLKQSAQVEVQKRTKIKNAGFRTSNPHETSYLNLEPRAKKYEKIRWWTPPGIQEYRQLKTAKQQDQSIPGRNPKVAYSSFITRNPADALQKAKIGSQIMQDNLKKPSIWLNDQGKSKSYEGEASSLANDLPFTSKHSAHVEVEKCKKIDSAFTRTFNPHEASYRRFELPLKMYERRRRRMPPGGQENHEVKMAKRQDQNLPGSSSKVANSLFIARGPADEQPKAHMGSQIMQDKFEEFSICLDDHGKSKSREGSLSFQAIDLPYASEDNARLEVEKCKKVYNAFTETVNAPETSCLNLEPPWKRYERIPWRMPPELIIRNTWFTDCGSESKEVEIQKNRLQLETETIYKTIHDIPPDPREPWEFEGDYDDSLTREIPILELPPNVQQLERMDSENSGKNDVAPIVSSSVGHTHKPDLELQVKLLKSPEMVSGSTSGDASFLETANLADITKVKGVPEAAAKP